MKTAQFTLWNLSQPAFRSRPFELHVSLLAAKEYEGVGVAVRLQRGSWLASLAAVRHETLLGLLEDISGVPVVTHTMD
jgi:hypothetical protein